MCLPRSKRGNEGKIESFFGSLPNRNAILNFLAAKVHATNFKILFLLIQLQIQPRKIEDTINLWINISYRRRISTPLLNHPTRLVNLGTRERNITRNRLQILVLIRSRRKPLSLSLSPFPFVSKWPQPREN